MAISPDFNYENLLSLDKAKLVSRERQNFLDTKELVLDYHQITSAVKEDAVEWLQTPTGSGGGGRLTLEDPEFSFKTYEGIWTCVSISYNENANIIQQVFKIDSTIGDLGDVDVESDFGLQSGDISRISDGMEVQRAYYWRITNPERIVLPSGSRTGEVWGKTASDNGDGTYDVIVTREVANDLEAISSVQAGPINGQTVNDAISGTCTVFGAYSEEIDSFTNSLPHAFAADYGGDPLAEVSVPNAVIGEIKRINNSPKENGFYNVSVVTRTAIPQRIPPADSTENSLTWDSDYSTSRGGGRIIIGINQSWETLFAELSGIQGGMNEYVVSCSPRINDYGLVDYTISAHI